MLINCILKIDFFTGPFISSTATKKPKMCFSSGYTVKTFLMKPILVLWKAKEFDSISTKTFDIVMNHSGFNTKLVRSCTERL